jgi:hypothetical protein
MIYIIIFSLILLYLHTRYVKLLSIRFNKDYALFFVRGLTQRRVKIIQTLNPSEPSQIIFYNIEDAHKYYLELVFQYHLNNVKELLDAKDNDN